MENHKLDKLKCTICKEKFYREDLKVINDRKKYCHNCINIYEKSKKEAEEYRILMKYLCDGFGIPKPTGIMLSQIKNFKDKGYKYNEIQWGVYYFINVLKRPLDKDNIGIIEYYIKDAMKFSIHFMNATNSANKYNPKSVVIKCNPNLKPNLSNTRYYDLQDLEDRMKKELEKVSFYK